MNANASAGPRRYDKSTCLRSVPKDHIRHITKKDKYMYLTKPYSRSYLETISVIPGLGFNVSRFLATMDDALFEAEVGFERSIGFTQEQIEDFCSELGE